MPSKKPNKKKKIEKTLEEIEKYWEKEAEAFADSWVWSEEDEPEMRQYLRHFCCHMVWTGLEALQTGITQEEREQILNEIMESGEWQLSEEEMLMYLPEHILKEELDKVSPFKEGIREMGELKFANLCNKLAEKVVYGMMNELEKKGYLTLAWDATKNDFVYQPGPNSPDIEGEGWKKNK